MLRKVLVIGAISLGLLIACGEPQQAGHADAAEEVKDDLTANPDYKAGLSLVAKSNCLTCHAVNQTTTGPAYTDIATKYAGADDTQINSLAQKIIKGGAGNWGQVPMIPHPNITEDEAKQMVKYILLLKK
jgi:cytochrome c